jgi:TolB protein
LVLSVAAAGGVCVATSSREAHLIAQNLEPDIGQKTQVTADRTLETTPAWSADGEYLYFVSDRFGGLAICRIARSGGGGVAAITQPAFDEVDVFPDVNPADGQIAFASNRARGVMQIWTVNPGTRGLTQLTNSPYGAGYPAWSPDGKQIAYSARDQNGSVFLWISNADGTNQRQITHGTQPRWSPDGRQLVYTTITQTSNRSYDVYTIDIGTNTQSQITSAPSNEYMPDWSKDGQWIAYAVFNGRLNFLRSGGEVRSNLRSRSNFEIWVQRVAPQAGASTQLTRSRGFDGWPRWTPGRRELAIVSDRSGNLDLWTMIPGGS